MDSIFLNIDKDHFSKSTIVDKRWSEHDYCTQCNYRLLENEENGKTCPNCGVISNDLFVFREKSKLGFKERENYNVHSSQNLRGYSGLEDKLFEKRVDEISKQCVKIIQSLPTLVNIPSIEQLVGQTKRVVRNIIRYAVNAIKKKEKFSLPKDATILSTGCVILALQLSPLIQGGIMNQEILNAVKPGEVKFVNKVNRLLIKLQSININLNEDEEHHFQQQRGDVVLEENLKWESCIISFSNKHKVPLCVQKEIINLWNLVNKEVWFGGKHPKNIAATCIFHILSGECIKIQEDKLIFINNVRLKEKDLNALYEKFGGQKKKELIKKLVESFYLKEKMLVTCNHVTKNIHCPVVVAAAATTTTTSSNSVLPKAVEEPPPPPPPVIIARENNNTRTTTTTKTTKKKRKYKQI